MKRLLRALHLQIIAGLSLVHSPGDHNPLDLRGVPIAKPCLPAGGAPDSGWIGVPARIALSASRSDRGVEVAVPHKEVDVTWVADSGLMMQAEGMSALLHTYQSF